MLVATEPPVVEDYPSDELYLSIFWDPEKREFFDDFGAEIINIHSYLYPWQVDVFLYRQEYIFFEYGPSGPIEVHWPENLYV